MMQFDPSELGADILRARERLFALGPADESAFSGMRHVTQKNTYDSLEALASAPLGAGLRLHVAWLLRARLLQAVNQAIEVTQTEETQEVERPDPVTLSHNQARDRLLLAKSEAEAKPWLEVFTRGTGYAEMRERDERSTEVLARLGLSPDAFMPEKAFDAQSIAREFLKQTRDLATHAGLGDWSSMMQVLRGDAALSALPRSLSLRWLHDRFPKIATPRIDPKTGPSLARSILGKPLALCGVSSFMRLLSRLGQTLEMCTETTVHDRIARADPACGHATGWGALFASLLMDKDFARKGLGVTQTEEGLLLRTASRVAFAHMLLTCYAVTPEPEEAEPYVFGRELAAPLRQYLRHRHLDASVELWGILSATQERSSLLDVFDSDWFRNPRTAEYFCAPRPTMVLCHDERPAAALATRAATEFQARLA